MQGWPRAFNGWKIVTGHVGNNLIQRFFSDGWAEFPENRSLLDMTAPHRYNNGERCQTIF